MIFPKAGSQPGSGPGRGLLGIVLSCLYSAPSRPGAVTMIKSELVQRIATQHPHLYQRDVENIVNAILNEITAALARGDRVELRGFGAFSVKVRDSRVGRNPRTGATVRVARKAVPFFKTGKQLRDMLNLGSQSS